MAGYQSGIPLITAFLHPVGEGLANPGVDDVADVAPRHLPDLTHDREGVDDDGVAHSEVQDGVHREVLVLGHRDDLDVVAVDGLQ